MLLCFDFAGNEFEEIALVDIGANSYETLW